MSFKLVINSDTTRPPAPQVPNKISVVEGAVQVQKRKQNMIQYRELFSALFKIKDLEVQNRVLNAINGKEAGATAEVKRGVEGLCSNCGCRSVVNGGKTQIILPFKKPNRTLQTQTVDVGKRPIATQTAQVDFDYLMAVNTKPIKTDHNYVQNSNIIKFRRMKRIGPHSKKKIVNILPVKSIASFEPVPVTKAAPTATIAAAAPVPTSTTTTAFIPSTQTRNFLSQALNQKVQIINEVRLPSTIKINNNINKIPIVVVQQQQHQQQQLHQKSPLLSKGSAPQIEPLNISAISESAATIPAPLLSPPHPLLQTQIINFSSIESLPDIDRIMPSLITDDFDIDKFTNEATAILVQEDVTSLVKLMKQEYLEALVETEGFLTIHKCVINGDLHKLKRQIIVYKFRNLNVNVRSNCEEGNTPLHFASWDAPNQLDMIDYLLANNASITEKNRNSDNVLHYAVKNTIELNVFRKLLSKADLSILSAVNDDGFAVLHLAVTERKFHFTKAIIDRIDELLDIENVTKDIWDAKQLRSMYERHISAFTSLTLPASNKIYPNKEKMSLINQRDIRAGRTALFYAVASENIDLSYLLLSEYADPRIPDLSGINLAFFTTDIIANCTLATAINNAEILYKFNIDCALPPQQLSRLAAVVGAPASEDRVTRKRKMLSQHKKKIELNKIAKRTTLDDVSAAIDSIFS